MPPNEIQPPYVLIFQEAAPDAEPLTIAVDDRPALPLFDSNEGAEAFLRSTDFGPGWKPVEVSGAGLLVILESCRSVVPYVALNPPPATAQGGMKVQMGDLGGLIRALETTQSEDDLFGLGGLGR